MTDDVAHEIAENIFAECQSGSSIWDEVNGPNAAWHAEDDGFQVKQIIRIPPFDPEGEQTAYCRITIEMEMQEPPFDEIHHRLHAPAYPVENCATCKYRGWLD